MPATSKPINIPFTNDLRRKKMWYFAWILGTLLACAFALVTALAVENHEAGKDAS
ncbi:hypothetical protein PBNK5_12290 [Pectobacterium brasiliense]